MTFYNPICTILRRKSDTKVDLQVFMNELSCFEQQLLFSIKEYILTETIGSINAKNKMEVKHQK